MTWQIGLNSGRYSRPGADASGRLWEISRGTETTQVVIEISDEAWSCDPLRLPDDTRGALETDGRTELLKVPEQDDPPRVVHCGCDGCTSPSRRCANGNTLPRRPNMNGLPNVILDGGGSMATVASESYLPAVDEHRREEVGRELQATLVELIDLSLPAGGV